MQTTAGDLRAEVVAQDVRLRHQALRGALRGRRRRRGLGQLLALLRGPVVELLLLLLQRRPGACGLGRLHQARRILNATAFYQFLLGGRRNQRVSVTRI